MPVKKAVMGKPPHKPTKDTRYKVKILSAVKTNRNLIAGVIGITDKTLTKYYSHELDIGETEICAKLIATAITRALVDKKDAVLIFLLKTVCGLREVQHIEHKTEIDSEELKEVRKQLDETQRKLEEIYKREF